jgi:hypothetical protein
MLLSSVKVNNQVKEEATRSGGSAIVDAAGGPGFS